MFPGFLKQRYPARALNPETDSSPLANLADQSHCEFPNLEAARRNTVAQLPGIAKDLAKLACDQDASVVLMGSWGRAEVTSGSDHDFMVLINGKKRKRTMPDIDAVSKTLSRSPGVQGIFSAPVFCDDLVKKIGLDSDDNSNLTRRMLLLLESRPATGEGVYLKCRNQVLDRYLGMKIKDFRPPRFLLNDVVRYWRTISVDFAAKEFEHPEKWGLRNAKLRLSRKVLFAGGLIPILRCFAYSGQEIRSFLHNQLNMSPTDRIADAFIEAGMIDEGARALSAYDAFVGMLNDGPIRESLHTLTRADAANSEPFQRVRQLGIDLQAGLLTLLFESRDLPQVVREYAIF